MERFVRRFSACVFDMDGTLCTSPRHPGGHDHVTGLTAAALLEYHACGGHVIVATGRPAAAATTVIDRDLPAGVVSLVVCCDGGCILKHAATAATGGEWQLVWEAGPSGDCILGLLSRIEQSIPQRCHFGVQLHEGFDGFGAYGSIVSSTRVQELLEAAHPRWGSYIRNMVPSGQRTLAQVAERLPHVLSREMFDAKLAQAAAVGWVRVVCDDGAGDSGRGGLTQQLQPLLEAENERGDCGCLEFVTEHLACKSTAFIRQAGIDKATALAFVEELIGVSAECFCVFGDGSNDVGMFAWAGWAVAPANALPKVKTSANVVSQFSNDENFIADFFTRPAPSNTDEAKVAAFTLPDPLRCADGSLVSSAGEWTKRRAEIMEVFRSQVYGRLPAVVVATTAAATAVHPDAGTIIADYSIVRREDGVLGGLGSRLEGVMQFSRHFGSTTTVVRTVPVVLFLPTKPAVSGAPIFCGLNFSGNHTVHSDPGITRSIVLEDPPILPSHRGAQASKWQVELLLSRGFGLLTMYSGDISR